MKAEDLTPTADFFISPEGNDAWAGTLAAPAADGSDGPFATLIRARDAVRERKEQGVGGDITVLLRGGTYRMRKTVVFGLQDGGGEGQRITYAAYPGETPVLSAGVPVEGWRRLEGRPSGLPAKARGRVWLAPIPRRLNRILTLYRGEQRLERAHGPVFKPVVDVECERVPSMNVARPEDRPLLRRLRFPPGALRDWPNLHDVELRFSPVPWSMNILPLASVDEEAGEAWLAVEATAPLSLDKCRWGIRAENVLDFLDGPGRWVVNTRERCVYLWPEGDRPGDDIVAPGLQELIRVEGGIDYDGPQDTPVRNLAFRGLTFMHGERDRTAPDYKGWGLQHDWEMFDKGTALMRLRGAEKVAVDACRFTSTSGSGLRLDLHCQRIRVTGNLFDHVGAAGILLCGYGPGTKDVNHHNDVGNNLLHHCGEVTWHGHAIFAWQSGSNRIANNRIHHCARKAIGLCGVRIPILENRGHDFDEAARTIRWAEIDATLAREGDNFDRFMPYLHTRDNVVEGNDVSRVLERLADGSALNVSGAGEGNIIRRNYLHHIATLDASSVLRVDDWQRGTLFVDNVVYLANVGAITRKNFNHVENNIFVDTSTAGYMRFASYPDETAAHGSRIRHNIFYETGARAAFYVTSYLVSPGASLPKDCDADYNLFFCAGDPEAALQFLEDMRREGIEAHSVAEDPCFVDLADGRFVLDPSSPALPLGFKPIDLSGVGLLPDFPAHYLALDHAGDEDPAAYPRGRDGKKAYAWW